MANTDASLARESCNTYSVTNNESAFNVGYKVSSIVGSTVTLLYTSGELEPDDVEEYEFASDGIYQVVIGTWQTGVLIKLDYYVVIVYCDIQTCMLSFIKELVCNTDTDCQACTDKFQKVLYYYNALALSFYAFLAIQNDIYVNNYVLSSLDEEILAQLASAQDLIDQMTNYCTCLNALSDDGESDCGCH